MIRVVEYDQKRHCLRAGFDRTPQAYQRTRPVLPASAFDDLIGLAGLAPGHRVAEIGCGTGQASVPLAERGMVITAVELGAGLAAIARRRLASFPSAEVLTTSFEDWAPRGAPFDAVVAVNSLHWIDPHLRYAARAAEARRRHGRRRMPLGPARGHRTLLDRRSGGLPGRGLRRSPAATRETARGPAVGRGTAGKFQTSGNCR